MDHYSLWLKLLKIGIGGKVLTVIQNIYSGAKSCMCNDKKLSDLFPCNISVCHLSPLLFSIFMNDLEQYLT